MKKQKEYLFSGSTLFFVIMLLCFWSANAQSPENVPSELDKQRANIKLLNAEGMGLFLQATGDSMRKAREKLIIVQDFYLKTGEKRLAASTMIVSGRRFGKFIFAARWRRHSDSRRNFGFSADDV